MDLINAKHQTINQLKNMIDLLHKEGKESICSLLIIPNGIIVGDIIDVSETIIEPNTSNVDFSFASSEYKDIVVNLKNVYLFSNSNFKDKIFIKQLTVFLDQIISYSVTDRKNFHDSNL